ncbi:hypothetical protein [Alkalitalea saponilacus]|uniref:NfeD-like C-terminal, partner-binding n=1 Tax=Alkalitalea saponilacus TaxID=889453 RepID=A0A1T5E871_9BACT|nr:hypothetical protein [Alkalitalea saponilacus]ASB49084.1 hypothetical protein CDL62_08000 [Alkalitalea saponilacus]SKB79993.1 hypothetical protein SAMN03080601_01231 [Alkalitalea saponilacus]
MDQLIYLYITAGVFGAGVILVDFFTNAISSFQSGEDDGSSSDNESSYDNDSEGSDTLADTLDDMPSHPSGKNGEKGSIIIDYKKRHSGVVLEFIRLLRTLVYFCAGFGLTGTFAILTGESIVSSLLWSVSVGFITVFLFKLFKRIQQRKLDSSFSDHELINLKGEALLPIEGSSMGKVRIFFGSLTLERYARTIPGEASIKKGDPILICKSEHDVVYVKRIEELN